MLPHNDREGEHWSMLLELKFTALLLRRTGISVLIMTESGALEALPQHADPLPWYLLGLQGE